ncbi:MAG: acetate kinase [Mucilaginibacter sp.]|nr:acetate kinase [Mucilaginibacter sp.]
MNIFVINSGSSSIKYRLFQMPSATLVCSGLVERIGLENATITHKIYSNGREEIFNLTLLIPDHETGLNKVNSLLTDVKIGVIGDTSDIKVVGHRIVHGGERFSDITIITPAVKEDLKQTFSLAPLHNPPGYRGIEVAEKIFADATQVAVFDTAFHQTMPPKAYRFAIPNSFYTDHHIRVYGFHGTSHKYVSDQAANYLHSTDLKLISIHLGNGCSMTAIKEGKSIDTSMGFGPLSGLIMGTRSGDIDPTVIFHLVNQLGYNMEQVSHLLNKQSGVLGLTGFSDTRDITTALNNGDLNARLTYDMYTYRIKKFIGAYTAVLNGLDAIIFTGGVGENNVLIREMVCKDMKYLGLDIDQDKNNMCITGIREINQRGSRVKILVIPTNEELEIANQCFELLK